MHDSVRAHPALPPSGKKPCPPAAYPHAACITSMTSAARRCTALLRQCGATNRSSGSCNMDGIGGLKGIISRATAYAGLVHDAWRASLPIMFECFPCSVCCCWLKPLANSLTPSSSRRSPPVHSSCTMYAHSSSYKGGTESLNMFTLHAMPMKSLPAITMV
jgi:hypothetical protein